jgi:hypothetical protein
MKMQTKPKMIVSQTETLFKFIRVNESNNHCKAQHILKIK